MASAAKAYSFVPFYRQGKADLTRARVKFYFRCLVLRPLPLLHPLPLSPQQCLHQRLPSPRQCRHQCLHLPPDQSLNLHKRCHPLAAIADRIVWELGHEVDVRMLGRIQGRTHSMQKYRHRIGLMSTVERARLVNRETINDESMICRTFNWTSRLSTPAVCQHHQP